MSNVVSFHRATSLSAALIFWKVLQIVFWLIGAALFLVMLINPPLGVLLFWNILIPVAPALLVIATGVWRNVCPLATTALLPERLGLSKKKAGIGFCYRLNASIGYFIFHNIKYPRNKRNK